MTSDCGKEYVGARNKNGYGSVCLFEKPEVGWTDMTETVKLAIEGGVGYTICGHVEDADGLPIPDVTLTAGSYSAATDASGDYILAGVLAGTYILTPSKAGHTFDPATRVVTVPPAATGQDFVGTPLTSTYSISGHVNDISDVPIEGAIVAATGGYSAITDAFGAYTITDLPPEPTPLRPQSLVTPSVQPRAW